MTSSDVIVAGGGSAGVAAALSTAREGARTLLIERHGMLGGAGSNALVHTFCGLFHPDVSNGPQWLNPGIPTEIGRRLLEQSRQPRPDLMGRVYVIRHEPLAWARLAMELCRNEPALTVQTQAVVTSVERAGEHWQLIVNGWQLRTRSLIDTTGDAALARLLGAEFWQTAPGERLYRPAYVFSLSGLAGPLNDAARLQAAALLVHAVKEGTLPQAALAATLRDSPRPGEVFVSMDLEAGGSNWDPLDPAKVAELEHEGQAAAHAIARFLRDHHPDFAVCDAPVLPVHPGIRESARWRGDYTLNAQDLLTSRRFEDEVALAGWPLEMRETAKGPKFRHFQFPRPAGIPARCLRNANAPNLFFAAVVFPPIMRRSPP